MTWIQAIGLAVLQGATELFPVSSLGHAVVVPALFHSDLDQAAASFLPFLVMLHVGTAAALLVFFWHDWWKILVGLIGIGDTHQVNESRRVFVLIVAATIPAVVVGAVLEHFFRSLFGAPLIAAGFLAANGVMLIAAEHLRAKGGRELASLTLADALVIGCWQCTALIPGISRSGATIVGGLLRGIDHAGAAHFSFMIATPIILGATVLEVPKLLHEAVAPGVFEMAAGAAVAAGLVAFLSTAFLMRYFRAHDDWALDPFGYYCIAVGLGAIGLLTFA